MKTFEDFLKDWHAKYYTGTDDNMPDAYEGWLEDLEIDTWISLGQLWGREQDLCGFNRAKEIAFKAITYKPS